MAALTQRQVTNSVLVIETGCAIAVGCGLTVLAHATDRQVSMAGLIAAISGLILAIAGLVVPLFKMFIDARHAEREEKWKRHDVNNKLNAARTQIDAMEIELQSLRQQSMHQQDLITALKRTIHGSKLDRHE